MYTIEKGVAVVNTVSDYCVGHRYGGVPVKMLNGQDVANAPKLVHVVVATLDDRVDGRDKVEIKSKITPRFLAVGVGEIWLPRILWEKRM